MKHILAIALVLLSCPRLLRAQCVPPGALSCTPGASGGYSCMSAFSSTPIGGTSTSLAVGDFNTDGLPDVAASPSAANAGIYVLANCAGPNTEPTGVLVDVTCAPLGPCPIGVGEFGTLEVGDLNGDGLPDLVGASDGPAGGEKGVGVFYQWLGRFQGDASPALAEMRPTAGCTSYPANVTVTGSYGTAAIASVTDPDTGLQVTSRGAGQTIAITGSNMGPGCRVLLTKATFPEQLEARVTFASDTLVVAQLPNAPAGVPTAALAGYTVTVHPVANLPGSAVTTLDVLETDSASAEPLPRIDVVRNGGGCVGQGIVIEGINFGSYVPGTSDVVVSAMSQAVRSWTETRIEADLVGGAPGYLTVVAAGGITRTSEATYVDGSGAPTPGIDAVSCGSGGTLVLSRLAAGWLDTPGIVTVDKGGPRALAPIADLDGDGTADWSEQTIIVHTPPLPDFLVQVTPDALPTFTTGTPSNTPIAASGGAAPHRYEIMPVPAAPAWLSLDPVTGVLSGTPPADGAFDLLVAAVDAKGEVGYRQYVLVSEAAGWSCGPAPSWTAGPFDPAPARDGGWSLQIDAGPVTSPMYVYEGPGIPGIVPTAYGTHLQLDASNPSQMRAGRFPFAVSVQSGVCVSKQAYELVVAGINVEVHALGLCASAPFGTSPGVSGCDATVAAASSSCFDGLSAIDVYGTQFGTSAEVVIDDGVAPPTAIVVTPLDPTHLVVTPPATTEPYVTLTVERLGPNAAASVSNPVYAFNASEVLSVPTAYGIEGATGASGELPLDFLGGPFGPGNPGDVIAWNGTTAAATAWSNGQVQGHAPAGARDWAYHGAVPMTIDAAGHRGILAGTLAPAAGAPAFTGVRLYAAMADGTLQEYPQWYTGLPSVESHRVAAADVNLDGSDDAIVMPEAGQATYDGGLRLSLNDGNTIFTELSAAESGLPETGPEIVRARLADLDVNGFLDVVALDAAGDTRIYFGLDPQAQSTTFDPSPLALDPAFAPAADVAIADFDGDGVLDIALSKPTTNEVLIAVGRVAGNGVACGSSYYCPVLDATISGFPGSPSGLAAALFDADDQVDLAVSAGTDVHVLLNDPSTDTIHDADATPGAETIESGQLELLP